MEHEKNRTVDVVNKLGEVLKSKSQLEEEIEICRQKISDQERMIYDQKLLAREQELEYNRQKSAFDQLNATLDSYQRRINIIQDDLEKSRTAKAKPRIISQSAPVSVSYEHVSKVIGRQVAENDLTLILGIGPKTAQLLKSNGVDTWEKLSETPLVNLSTWLLKAGGIYKTQDPTSWSKQAGMAAQGEWRKLRIFQETLRNKD
jgi:predicted flap endonuclease-1-like 5' DNA nuclease